MSEILSQIQERDVETEVSALRDTKFLVRYHALAGVICPDCGSGEIYQPMQTCDMPMHLKCINCNASKPAQEFEI